MSKYKKIAFLFPGQGVQYPGMGKDFVQSFSAARLTMEETDDILGRKLSQVILEGPDTVLTKTRNSQTGIFAVSIAILRVIQETFAIQPVVCAGLSLGEYTALAASEFLSFMDCLPLVERRGILMNEACEQTGGKMAVIIGLEADTAERVIKEVNLPGDLWIANFNCPGQVVISGTAKGVEAGSAAAKAHGAKRILPLQVHGAFHSGLMSQTETCLAGYIYQAPLKKGVAELVMNVPGDFVSGLDAIRHNLIKQVTSSVRWEQGIRAMDRTSVDLYIEIGPGKTLSGMNKRIGVKAPTLNIETVEDLDILSAELNK